MSGQYTIAWLCEALLVSRSGYYDWIKRRRCSGPRQLENARLRERIREEFARSRKTYGSPRLAQVLGCPGRRNRIARLMRVERIFARQRSKYRPMTTDSGHGGPIAPNRVRTLKVRRPNQVWTTDATCILTAQGWLYLVVVLDVFSRRVIGWAMNQLLDASLCSAALRMAINQRHYSRNLIVHSDRGAQFASSAYRQLLSQHRLTASMSRRGNCYDNAFIESFFSSLKYELVYYHRSTASPRLVLRSSITSKPSITAPDFTPVLTTKALSTLNPYKPNYPLPNCPRKQGNPRAYY